MAQYLDIDGLSHFWQKIKVKLNALANSDTEYIIGTQTAATGSWTGVSKRNALYDGMEIAYWLPFAGSGNATLELTLAGGDTTGAIPIYRAGTTAVSTQYGAKSLIRLTYIESETAWYADADYNTTANNNYRLYKNYAGYKAYTALYRYQICLTKDEQYILPVNAVKNSTGTSKTLTTESFDPFGPIYYYITTADISADANCGANLALHYLADLRYSFNEGKTLMEQKAVYIVADIQSDGKAKLASSPLSQELPSTEDGHIYIYLGQTYDNYRIEIVTNHPVYWYKDGAVRPYSYIPS